jgi:3-hexulose-6-phosphate synthase
VKLQIALDGDLDSSLAVLRAIRAYVDIAEIGTPLVYREGLRAVHVLRREFPDLALLADYKIVDAGEHEAALAFEAGCDVVTVLGVAPDSTIRGALRAASRFGRQVMADLMQVRDLVPRSRALLDLGCHCLCVHTATDLQASGDTPLADLARLRAAFPAAPLAVAGGLDAASVPALAPYAPQVVIVGGAIVTAPDPAFAARQIRAQLDRYQDHTP